MASDLPHCKIEKSVATEEIAKNVKKTARTGQASWSISTEPG